MRMRRFLIVSFIMFLPLASYGSGSGGMGSGGMGGSSGSSGSSVQVPARSPAQRATSSYESGLKHKAKALEYLEEAKAAKDERGREKSVRRANDQFESAVKDYKKAIGYNSDHYQAMNELGFAYRKLGDFPNSLKSYNHALTLMPGFAPAIEYRAEAFLGLAMFEDTKSAYLELFRSHQDRAALLMQAFDEWMAGPAKDASPEAQAFAAWVTERKQLAEVTQAAPGNLQRTW